MKMNENWRKKTISPISTQGENSVYGLDGLRSGDVVPGLEARRFPRAEPRTKSKKEGKV